MKSHATLACFIPIAALAFSGSAALAQGTCGTPPTNVFVASAVCNPTVRISWTNPVGVGIVNPKVWRGTTSNFADATLVYVGGSGSPTTIFNAVPTANTNYYFWVGGDVFGCGGSAPSQTQPLPRVGPLVGGAFTPTTYPLPQLVSTCNGVRVNFQPTWDATGYHVLRLARSSTIVESLNVLANTPQSPVSSFDDTTALPGVNYNYGVLIESACGSPTSGSAPNAWPGPAGLPVIVGASVSVGQTATLIARNALGIGLPVLIPEPQSFSWRRNGQQLPGGGRFSGINTSSLQISNALLEDAGLYELRITPSCSSQPIMIIQGVLSITQPCRADYDQNGTASTADIFEFLNSWFAGCP